MGRRLSVLLAVALSLTLASCTNDPYPASDQDTKVVYKPFDTVPKSLDPAFAYSTTAHKITANIYETLLEYHYLKRPYELIPGLAEAVPKPEPREDGRVAYRFKLRPGLEFQDDPSFARFHDGKTNRGVLASDFAFEFARLADPAVKSPVINYFQKISGFEDFSKRLAERREADADFAALPVREQYAQVGPIEGVQVGDPRDLTILLDEAYPQILYWFAMPFTTPVPWEAVQHYDGEEGRPHFRDQPVGVGPYRMAVYDKQFRIVLERNERWYGIQNPEWQAPGAVFPTVEGPTNGALDPRYAGRALPFIERIEFRREKEAIPAFSKFLQGYYDTSGIINESFDTVVQEDKLSEEMVELGMHLEKTPAPTVFYIGFNMDDVTVGAPAGERGRKLRQAMSLVIDSKEFTLLFLNGRGIPAQSPLPPGIYGYDEAYENPYRRVDLERAKALLVEAGYARGIDPETGQPLKLTFDTGNTSSRAILRYQFFIDAWRRLGLDVELKATTYSQFQEKVRNGAYQTYLWGWSADYPDPENFFLLLETSNGRTKSGGPNSSNFSHPAFDELFFRMRSMENNDTRLALITEMRGILEEQRPWIELFHSEDYTLSHGWMKNIKPAGMSIPFYKYHDVDPQQRAGLRAAWNEPVLWPLYVLLALAVVVIVPGVRTYLRERQ